MMKVSDTDIINLEHLSSHEAIKDDLILSILKVFNEYSISFELDKDILVFTSHSLEEVDSSCNKESISPKFKRSYHIIIDNYFHENNLESQAFAHLVIAKMKDEYKPYVDTSVYKPLQQFRIYGNQKRGSNRPKIFCETWSLCGNVVTYPYPKFSSDMQKEIYILGVSLVSNCKGCKSLPTFRPTYQLLIDAKRQAALESYDVDDLNSELAKRAMIVLAKSAGLTIYDPIFPYKLRKINGNLLDLKRTRPSRCKICDRVHEHIDPFLIVKDENMVYYGCRRANNKTIHVGNIITEDYIKDDASKIDTTVDEDPPEISLSHALQFIQPDGELLSKVSSETPRSSTPSQLLISPTPSESPCNPTSSQLPITPVPKKVKVIKVKINKESKSELFNNFEKNKQTLPSQQWYLSQRLATLDLTKLKL
jgi:hypothetical protein